MNRRHFLATLAASGAATAAVNDSPACASTAVADATLVCFGDSITAGTWTGGQSWASLIEPGMTVINQGIGGTALAFPCAENGMPPLRDWIPPTARRLGATHVVVAAGINDLIRTDDMTLLASAACQVVDRLEEAGIVVWWATVTPYRSTAAWAEILDGRRVRWNTWLRTNLATRLIDFEPLLSDGKWLRPEYSVGDSHPNLAGQAKMAEGFATAFQR